MKERSRNKESKKETKKERKGRTFESKKPEKDERRHLTLAGAPLLQDVVRHAIGRPGIPDARDMPPAEDGVSVTVDVCCHAVGILHTAAKTRSLGRNAVLGFATGCSGVRNRPPAWDTTYDTRTKS